MLGEEGQWKKFMAEGANGGEIMKVIKREDRWRETMGGRRWT